jgi:hypothetical protein
MIGSPLNGGFKTGNEPAKTQNGLILCCLSHDLPGNKPLTRIKHIPQGNNSKNMD